jgi:hypothetical protein
MKNQYKINSKDWFMQYSDWIFINTITKYFIYACSCCCTMIFEGSKKR